MDDKVTTLYIQTTFIILLQCKNMKQKSRELLLLVKDELVFFNKVAELCVLCNTHIVMLVSASLSKREKFYTFAHPSINLLLDSFLNNHVPYPNHNCNNLSTFLSSQNTEQLTPKNDEVSKTKRRKRKFEES